MTFASHSAYCLISSVDKNFRQNLVAVAAKFS